MYPPPPVKVPAAPAPVPASSEEVTSAEAKEKSWIAKHWWKIAAGAVFTWPILTAPAGSTTHFLVFALAVVIGFYVITSVTYAPTRRSCP